MKLKKLRSFVLSVVHIHKICLGMRLSSGYGESLCSVFQMCFRSLSSVHQMSFRSVSSVCEFSPSVQGFCCCCCCCCTWSHSSVILHYLRTCMFKCCLLLFNVLLYILGNPIVDQLHPCDRVQFLLLM